MKTVNVTLTHHSYPIYIGENLLAQTGSLLKNIIPQKRVIIIADSKLADNEVEENFCATLTSSLDAENIVYDLILTEGGENTKSFGELEKLLERLLALRPDRKTTLLALGGGCVGDAVGFAASILLRGVPFVQIPTTLLAQVDSSVGGKTAINSQHGKNLIGSFYQPLAVIADISTLCTLAPRQMLAGYAEIMKYGLINDADFFEWLEQHAVKLLNGNNIYLSEAIYKSCQAKATIVMADEKETKDLRALLNLGHTFGHALEKENNYGDLWLHGEAVAIGCLMALELSHKIGICPKSAAEKLQKHLQMVGLPTTINQAWSAKDLAKHCLHDKKVENNQLTFIVAKNIGQAEVCRTISLEQVTEIFTKFIIK